LLKTFSTSGAQIRYEDGSEAKGLMVCEATIYIYIQQDKALGAQLYQHLRHKTYKKRTGSADARDQIVGRISIEERPPIVDKKAHLGS